MKNTVFFITFLFLTFLAKAQNIGLDQRLLSKFTKNELNEMQSKSPDKWAYWNFYAANAYQVVDLPAEKANAHEIRGTVKILDISAINIFDLNYIPLKKEYQYYRIEGTNKLLMIISEEQIKEKFSAVTKKKN